MNKPKVSLCLSGAGSRGILTLGYLQAWKALGLEYDFLHGTSSGCLNAMLFHQDELDVLEELWMTITQNDVYKINAMHWLNPFVTDKCAIGSSDPLRKLITKYLNPAKVRAATKPCFINTTNVTTYSALTMDLRTLTDDEMVDFVLASASPPIAFPYVNFRGNVLYDGGLVDNSMILDAVDMGADIIVLMRPALPTLGSTPKNLLDAFGVTTGIPEDFAITREKQFISLVNKIQAPFPDLKTITVITVEPKEPIGFTFLDFSFKGYNRKDLIQLGYNLAYETLSAAFK